MKLAVRPIFFLFTCKEMREGVFAYSCSYRFFTSCLLPDGEKKTNVKKKIAKYERFIFLFLK
jgi:hypothetical protein